MTTIPRIWCGIHCKVPEDFPNNTVSISTFKNWLWPGECSVSEFWDLKLNFNQLQKDLRQFRIELLHIWSLEEFALYLNEPSTDILTLRNYYNIFFVIFYFQRMVSM